MFISLLYFCLLKRVKTTFFYNFAENGGEPLLQGVPLVIYRRLHAYIKSAKHFDYELPMR